VPKAKAAVVRYGAGDLPRPVIEMREAILAAVASGRIEDLRIAIEMNEIRPAFPDGPETDPIAYLKSQSADGEARDVLGALGAILEAGYAVVPLGRDLENNRIFVWPHFAETGIGNLSSRDAADLERIAGGEAVSGMRRSGRYSGWRIGIGADGTWHVLSR
jgi:hypothetical protein